MFVKLRNLFFTIVSVGLARADDVTARHMVNWATCFEVLELPTNSVMASFMRGTSTVRAEVTFSSGGRPSIRIEGGTVASRREISDLFDSSRFRGTACAGKMIDLKFTFVVEGEPGLEIYPPRTVFQSPNHFTFYFRPRGPYSDYPPPL